jgi:Uma2 family endonuclease
MTQMAQIAPAWGPHTWEDFIALEEDDPRELIDGHLVELEVPTWLHERIVAELCTALRTWARPRKAGEVLASGYKVRIAPRRGVMPDLQFFRDERLYKLPQTGLEAGHPDLAVEVVSQSSKRYDRMTKLGWYASIGVPEYWIVDPETRTLERLLLRGGRYLIAEVLSDDMGFRPDTFEGLEIALGDLWVEGTAE